MKRGFKSLFGKTANDSPFEKEKVFCIGLNKTGTTSLELALKELGYRLGDQHQGEMFLQDYARRDFSRIINFCHTADAFQDAPFSYPFTFILLDQHFPRAKFILTVRDNAEQWLDSLIRFQAKLFNNGETPTKETLQEAFYLYKGRPWEASRILFNTPEDDIYHAPTMHAYYNNHNAAVREYFRTKNNLLEINVSDKDAYLRMCAFLGKKPTGEDFPWLNKS